MTPDAARGGAARGGSDLLGLDDETSRDFDSRLRRNLFVPPEMATGVDAALAVSPPDQFAERPTRFTLTSDATVRHRGTESPGHRVTGFAVAHVGGFAA